MARNCGLLGSATEIIAEGGDAHIGYIRHRFEGNRMAELLQRELKHPADPFVIPRVMFPDFLRGDGNVLLRPGKAVQTFA